MSWPCISIPFSVYLGIQYYFTNNLTEWVDTAGAKESTHSDGPRYQLFIFANKQSIYSILDPKKFEMSTGYYINLVHASITLKSPSEKQGDLESDPEEDRYSYDWMNPSQSLKQIRADLLVVMYSGHLKMDRWCTSNQERPPHVLGNGIRWQSRP